MLTGCGANSKDQKITDSVSEKAQGLKEQAENAQKTEKEDKSDKADASDTSSAEENLNAEPAAEKADSEDLYESFLANKAKAHISTDNDFGYYFNFEDSKDKELTLEEIVNAIIAGYIDDNENAKIWLGGISYAYIDCGKDGNKELALIINTPMDIENWEQYLIIKDIDGRLETVYSNVAWSRSELFINEYGYIYGDGSGGAAYHGFDKSFVDADGKWHFIYSDESTDGVSSGEYSADIWFDGESHKIPDNTVLDGNYVFLDFNFDYSSDGSSKHFYTYGRQSESNEEDDEWGNGFKGYFYQAFDYDDSIYADNNPLKQFFDKEGLHIYTLKEIDKMIADKEAKEGLTEAVKNGADPDWKELSYDFEPYIATLNSDNFLKIKEYFPLYMTLCTTAQNSTYMTIESDGSISGSYSDWNYNNANGSSVTNKNEYTGKFEVKGKESNTVYNLVLTDYQLKNTVGESENHEYTKGSISVINYVAVPGFSGKDEQYYLYCPGTKLSEMEENILSVLPDYFIEDKVKNDVLQSYILYEPKGDYVWRMN